MKYFIASARYISMHVEGYSLKNEFQTNSLFLAYFHLDKLQFLPENAHRTHFCLYETKSKEGKLISLLDSFGDPKETSNTRLIACKRQEGIEFSDLAYRRAFCRCVRKRQASILAKIKALKIR